jgi:uncharacterized protein (DUF433 family)
LQWARAATRSADAMCGRPFISPSVELVASTPGAPVVGITRLVHAEASARRHAHRRQLRGSKRLALTPSGVIFLTMVFDRITVTPGVMGGQPCIRGMRVSVSMIVGEIGAGRSLDEVLEDFPYLEREDVLQALRYAAWRVSERDIELT